MTTSWKWTDSRDLCIEGRGWQETDAPFDRLPLRARGRVPDVVWDLSRMAAGITVRFESDAPELRVRWELASDTLHWVHSPLLACSGLDFYGRADDGAWRWVGVTRELTGRRCECLLYAGGDLQPVLREFLIYLPLGNPVKTLQIGVPEGAMIRSLPARTDKPIVCYGTSICHGMGVSRPGMTHLAQLGRRLDYPIINLGVSGNAKMELAVAELLAELDAALFIIDAIPNMEAGLISERAEPFLRQLAAARPGVPILLVEDRTYPAGWLVPAQAKQNAARREAFRQVYGRLLADGVGPLRYLPGEGLLGIDGDGTNDGSHPNDLGAHRMANALEPCVRALLEKS
jgi:lysophospholipase L1-like esterase